MEQHLPRKLAAIFYADVAGYSRLTGDDEDATHRTLSEYLDLISTVVTTHRGQVMHYAGDAVLAQFNAALDALSAAVAVQTELERRNEFLPEGRRVRFRIGVNLGDVIEDRGDIYGDGVNVAARLEALAEPGGICVSESLRAAVGEKMPLEFVSLGDQKVKNIDKPVHAHRVTLIHQPSPTSTISAHKSRKYAAGWLAAAVAAVAVGIAAWWYVERSEPPAETAAAWEKKPAIAVLPFNNISNDPEQEYFADGIAEDLITDLSKVSGLMVISRNSSFAYKGQSPDVRQVAKELGVSYVLEGSVRRAEDKVRINVQLIDGTNGAHIWADRYDGNLGDIFALQDRLTGKIISALQVALSPEEAVATVDRGTSNIEAYDAFLKGWSHMQRRTPEDAAEAVQLFKRAVALDPNYSRAYSALAQVYWDYSLSSRFSTLMGLQTGQGQWNTEFTIKEIAWSFLQKAQVRPTSQTHALAARIYLRQRRFDEALEESRKAVKTGPNNSLAYDVRIENLIYANRIEEAIRLIDRSFSLDPNLPGEKLFLRGLASYADGRMENAVDFLDRARSHNPEQLRYIAIHTAALAELGQREESRTALKEFVNQIQAYPHLNWIMFEWPFESADTARRLANGLIESGLPNPPNLFYGVNRSGRLSALEIRRLLSGKTMIGNDLGPAGGWDSFEFEVTRDNEGQIVSQGYITYFKNGRTTIENDVLCDPWWGLENLCVAIYRNPGGTPEKNNEYVFYTLTGLFTFSILDSNKVSAAGRAHQELSAIGFRGRSEN